MIKFDKIMNIAQKDYSKADNITKELGISKLTAKVLINRGIEEIEKCKEFINPSIEHFFDPFLLNDMDKGVNRIIDAIKNKEKIWIYGDYDVDGITSTTILKLFFRSIGVDVDYYIPDRIKEGYGLNKDAIDYIFSKEGNLVITVDCGITSIEVVERCNELGIDIIITDHHECGPILPDAIAIINPNRKDTTYPYQKLAGVGVALKLIQALSIKLNVPINYNDILPIAAIGTVADVVSLIGENRIIVKNGLKLISKSNNLGLRALIEVSGLKGKEITSGHIGFILGPRINATGRMGHAKYGVELFTTESKEEAYELAKLMNEENLKRQNVEDKILKEANDIIQRDIDLKNEWVIVVASENWHSGVIGIVSSRITEKYYRPSIVISVEEDEGKGSARSIPTFDIYDSLSKCKELFKKFGGHKQAAGLSIKKESINIFREKINDIAKEVLSPEDLIPEIRIDSKITAKEIDINTVKEIQDLEPFGIDNPSPQFLYTKGKIKNIRQVGKDNKHLKLCIEENEREIDCIGFNLGNYYHILSSGDLVDLVVTLDVNKYNGNENVQLIIKEIKKTYEFNERIEENYFLSLKNALVKGIGESEQLLNDCKFEFKNNIDRLSKTIEVLQDDKSSLILVHDYKNLFEIINEIGTKGRELLKQTSICYNTVDGNKKNCIVVNPFLQDINFDFYDKVILYDFHFYNDKYSNILNKTQKSKVEVFALRSDIIKNINILKKLIPNIEELRLIYKTFLFNRSNVLKLDVSQYLNYLKGNYNVDINKIKFQLSLEILKEAKLIEFKGETVYYYIRLCDRPSERIDIKKLSRYKYLNNLIEKLFILNKEVIQQ